MELRNCGSKMDNDIIIFFLGFVLRGVLGAGVNIVTHEEAGIVCCMMTKIV